jgi:hypothetical protein
MKAERSLIRVAACAVLWTLCACSDDSSPTPVEASDFCEAYVDLVCQGLEKCCSDQLPLSELTCRNQTMALCEGSILTVDDRGIAPTGANVPARIVFDFDEEGAGAALSGIRAQFARCAGPGAQAMFDETHYLGDPGAECLRHEDCEEGTRCVHPALAVFGTCVMAPLEGELCEDVCAARDISCVPDANNELVCVGPRKEGQSCEAVGCDEGLVCAETPSVSGGELRCVVGLRRGESCSFDSECQSAFCLAGKCGDTGGELSEFCGSFVPGFLLTD